VRPESGRRSHSRTSNRRRGYRVTASSAAHGDNQSNTDQPTPAPQSADATTEPVAPTEPSPAPAKTETCQLTVSAHERIRPVSRPSPVRSNQTSTNGTFILKDGNSSERP
jgi:hypothetical protein